MKGKWKNPLAILVSIVLITIIISIISLIFSTVPIDIENIRFIITKPDLFLLNFLPILALMCVMFFLTNRIWISSLITSLVVLGFTFVNFLKITYRSEPLIFEDLKLFRESLMMQGEYSISVNQQMIIAIIAVILFIIFIMKFIDLKVIHTKYRVIGILITVFVLVFSMKTVYSSSELYDRKVLKYNEEVNTPLGKYVSNGFVYPFAHSIMSSGEKGFREYDNEEIKNVLSDYDYKKIPEDKKVNIIAVMLESFSDFSDFEELEFIRDPYENWHRLEEDGISGNLLVNVFGGGTINTELSFINGTFVHTNYKDYTNSYLWYFRNEGYNTYGMHPSNGWFYDRYDTYANIGAEEYLALENNFEEKGIDGFKDKFFFEEIIDQFEERRVNGKPQFNMSVTYQNHGPYLTNFIESNQFVVTEDHYDSEGANILNNYLAGIWDTDQCLNILVNHFENHEEPVILIFFGDHKPWLGEEDLGYKTFGIDTNLNTLDGYLNYYKTPFIIYGNQMAKEMFGKDFKSDAGIMSPQFLMNYLMKYLEIEGDEYNQYVTDLTEDLFVSGEGIYNFNGEFKTELNTDEAEKIREYFEVQYYRVDNFRYDQTK